jgi:hypothetical protein
VDQWFSVINRLKRSRLDGLLSPQQWIEFLEQTGRSAQQGISGTVEICAIWTVRAIKNCFAENGFQSAMKGHTSVRNFKFAATSSAIAQQYNIELSTRLGQRSTVSMQFRDELQSSSTGVYFGTGTAVTDPAVFPMPLVPARHFVLPNYVAAEVILSGIDSAYKSMLRLHLNNASGFLAVKLQGTSDDQANLLRCKGEWTAWIKQVEGHSRGSMVDFNAWTVAELFDIGDEIRHTRQIQLGALQVAGASRTAEGPSAGAPARPPIHVPGVSSVGRGQQKRADPHIIDVSLNVYDWKHNFGGFDVICDACREPVEDQFVQADSCVLTEEFRKSPNLDCALCNCTFHLRCITGLGGALNRGAILTGQWWAKAPYKALLDKAFSLTPGVWLVCGKCMPEYNRLMVGCCRDTLCEGPNVDDDSESDGGSTAAAADGESSSSSSSGSDEARVSSRISVRAPANRSRCARNSVASGSDGESFGPAVGRKTRTVHGRRGGSRGARASKRGKR